MTAKRLTHQAVLGLCRRMGVTLHTEDPWTGVSIMLARPGVVGVNCCEISTLIRVARALLEAGREIWSPRERRVLSAEDLTEHVLSNGCFLAR